MSALLLVDAWHLCSIFNLPIKFGWSRREMLTTALSSHVLAMRPIIIVFTIRYPYGFMFVISGNSRWQRSMPTFYKARNHLCSHFAAYLSNEIRSYICVYTLTLVRSLLKDSPVRYSSKYHEDRVTGILKWWRSETNLLHLSFLYCVVLLNG